MIVLTKQQYSNPEYFSNNIAHATLYLCI